MGYASENATRETAFQKLLNLSKSIEPLLRNRDTKATQNEHVYAICCRPEDAYDTSVPVRM